MFARPSAAGAFRSAETATGAYSRHGLQNLVVASTITRRITTRAAVPADAEALAKIHVRAWQFAYPGLVEPHVLLALSVREHKQRWNEILGGERGDNYTIVAELDGTIAGFCVVAAPSRDADEPAGVAEIAAIYVDPSAQGRGVGKALMHDAIASLGPEWHTLTVWTLTENYRALAFYAAFGFERDGSERTDDHWLVPDVRLRRSLGYAEGGQSG